MEQIVKTIMQILRKKWNISELNNDYGEKYEKNVINYINFK